MRIRLAIAAFAMTAAVIVGGGTLPAGPCAARLGAARLGTI
ncbi:hypothetical protein ACSNOK_04095 [Streptomyces sp. URMC 126]